MKKITPQTKDITTENIKQIATLFPQVITEKKDANGNTVKAIDFELLKQHLTNEIVEGSDERYRLDWPGKRASILKANTPITSTLKPDRNSSVHFDTTENLYIEGDNFEVLKILQESYLGKVKMIYIDPPYNTGKDFVYKDNFKMSKADYEDELELEDEDGGKLFKNTDTNGRFHSDWLSMMYERLLVARDLLTDDGVIFMSIDDNEVHNLRKIADEVFGEENFLTQMIWRRRKTQANLAKNIAPVHDYIITISKKISNLTFNKVPFSKKFIQKSFSNKDNDIRGLYQTGPLARPANSKNKEYELTLPNGRKISAKWSCSQTTFDELIKDNRLVIPRNGEGMPRKKIFLSELDGLLPNTWLDNIASNDDGAKEISDLFGSNAFFSYPKPIKLIKYLMNMGLSENDLILDFFSGSASTAHATMQLNAEDGGNRKFIMVQLPEETDEKSEAYKAGYKHITEIGKERIRRAGKKILEDNAEKLAARATPLDIGFRVYKTAETILKNVAKHPNELVQGDLFSDQDNIKESAKDEDILTAVLLDFGEKLDNPIATKTIAGSEVFIVDKNALVACFSKNINMQVVEAMAKMQAIRAVFRDACFKDDKDLINTVESRFKQLAPNTKVHVI